MSFTNIASTVRKLAKLTSLVCAVILLAGETSFAARVSLSGTAVQGRMVASTVIAYAVDTATGANVRLLGKTETDTNGDFVLHIHRHRRPVRLVVKGGSFVSEADGTTISFKGQRLTVLLPSAKADVSGISINPLTAFINALAVKQRWRYSGLRASLSAATATIESDYGLSTDPATLIPDYTAAGVGTDAGNLGLILGAFINEDQYLCPDAPGGLVRALAKDISNGTFNGMRNGRAIHYCGGNLPAIAGTIDFQDALSGVTQLQNVSEAFAFGGTNNILTASGLADGATGGSEIYPIGPLAEITSAVTRTVPPPPSAPSPSMATARGSATATLLPNGKVLVAGGFPTSSNDAVNTTVLYDPISNTLRAGPSMSQARGAATATLLPNGKVLIAGGLTAGGPGSTVLASTEIYDSATNTIVPGPLMNVARASAGATLLPNGKVLIAGGGPSSTEIYDPSANSFTAGPSMSVAEELAQATLLPNGKVLITGSAVSGGVSVAELYDPATNTMSELFMNSYRPLATAVLLPNGKVLIAGGMGDPTSQPGSLNTTEIYDPAQDGFVDGPPMNVSRWMAMAVPVPDGDVLIIGGLSGSTTSISALDDVEIYDPSTNSFSTATAPMNEARFAATATLLANGSVFIAGGANLSTNSLSSTEIYNP